VVNYEHRDTDRDGRMVAVCVAGGVDLGRWLVQQGHALAYRKYSLDYVRDEDAARTAKAGLWAGEFQNPAESPASAPMIFVEKMPPAGLGVGGDDESRRPSSTAMAHSIAGHVV
jgi:hypothetical protein